MTVVWTTGFTPAEEVLLPLGATLAICGLVIYAQMIRRLRDQHRDKWDALGSPTLLSGSATSWRVIGYLLRSGYQELGDLALERLARLWRFAYVLFLLVMAALIYQILRFGP